MVDEDEANLHLYVSTESFHEPRVPVSVSIDGVVLVDEPFDVEGQHNWQAFPIAVGAGTHEVVVTGPNGATTTQQLVVPQRGDLWAVTNYWTNDRKGSLLRLDGQRPAHRLRRDRSAPAGLHPLDREVGELPCVEKGGPDGAYLAAYAIGGQRGCSDPLKEVLGHAVDAGQAGVELLEVDPRRPFGARHQHAVHDDSLASQHCPILGRSAAA